MRRLRFALLAAALALAACGPRQGEVFSDKPLFTNADAEGAPRLRPGLWVAEADDCVFDTAKPLGAWPTCAFAVVVRDGEMLTGPQLQGVLRQRIVLAAGYPRILQARVMYQNELHEPEYYGLRPTRIEGDIVAFKRWPVRCSPTPPPDKEGNAGKLAAGPSATPGVDVGADGRCRLADRDQLQRALLASEAWEETPLTLRWVRESET